MTTDLERAYKALSGKAAAYTRLFQYYDGDQPVMYTAKRLEEFFKGLDAAFTENWCAVVIDSVRDRVNLRSIRVPKAYEKAWAEMWEGSELKLESDDVHEASLVIGEAFVVAWPDEDGKPQAYYNDPRLCHVFYRADNPRVKAWAAKWWVRDDETLEMTLYYPDRLEYYETEKKQTSVSSANAFGPKNPAQADNPYGVVPVFHFRPSRRTVKGDLKNVIPMQNGINKLLADMMVAAEFGAFKQRFIISNADIPGKLKNAPNEVWDLPAGDGMGQQTQAGQFAAAQLENYLKAIDSMATAVSSITRTPKHYFFSIGSNLSGEALIAMESPLVKKAWDRIDRYYPEWQRLIAFMFAIKGKQVDPRDIQPIFDNPETIQPRTRAETRDYNVRAGMPLVTALREEGWTEEQIQVMLKDQEDEAKRRQTTLAKALLDAEREFDRRGGDA